MMARRTRRGGGEKRDGDLNTLDLELSVCKAWGELYESGLHSDITFLVGPMQRSFPAHKLVLSTHSSTFAAMLYNGMEESSASTITLADHDAGVFECLLNYMYTGQVKMHKDHVRKLIRLADYYAVDVLRENVGEWIGRTLIDKNNVCEYIVFAADHNVHSLHKHCYRFMLGNAKDIFFSREFRDSIPYEILEKMVVSDDLNLTEIELFESLLKWGVSKVQISPYNNMGMKKSVAQSTDGDGEGSESSDHHSSDDDVHPSRSSRGNSLLSLRDLETEAFTPEYSKALRSILEPLVSHVRLPFIDPEQLLEDVKPTGLVDSSTILQAIAYHISKKEIYPPNHVQIRPRKNTVETRYTLMKNREPLKTQPFLHSETAGGEDDSSSW